MKIMLKKKKTLIRMKIMLKKNIDQNEDYVKKKTLIRMKIMLKNKKKH